MMTLADFINMLRVYRRQDRSLADLSTKSIDDMLRTPMLSVFRHGGFETLDAEDSVFQLCRLLHRLNADYVPIVDPDEGNLVAVLGYLDLVHLLHEAAKQYPQFFSSSLLQLGIGTYEDLVTAPQTMLLFDVIELLEARNISGIPVTNEFGLVIGQYHRSDVSFITRAADPDSAMAGIHTLQIGDALRMQQTAISESSALHSDQTLCTCFVQDSLASVLDAMMRARVTRVVCVDSSGRCVGVISIKDIVAYYFVEESRRSSSTHH
jgi:CBS domain-containing protein